MSSGPVDRRTERARAMAAGERLRVLAGLVEIHREFLGLLRFQEWVTSSERVVDLDGSPWWREVNGLLIVDILDSREAAPMGSVPPSVHAWRRHWASSSAVARRNSFWAAHQESLAAAQESAAAVLVGEPDGEQRFIELALGSVSIAAGARLPTGPLGARMIGSFCDVVFPSAYPADRSVSGSTARRAAVSSTEFVVARRRQR
ncbi:MAG: hypothetical protein U0Q22_04400 [Acidimicrobiales bacterium]